MELMEFIKAMWSRMYPGTKKEVVSAASTALGVSEEHFKQRWIWQENLPEEHQHTVAEIFHDALEAQDNENVRLRKSVVL